MNNLIMENPCINCSETYRKRPRCKSLKCPIYFEYLEEEKNMDNVMSSIKNFAENNMCASCFSDIEKFVEVINDIINGGENIFLNECMDKITTQGLTTSKDFVDFELRREAELWLKDYYKNKKDYDSEEITIDN